jgi:hypothetical protein
MVEGVAMHRWNCLTAAGLAAREPSRGDVVVSCRSATTEYNIVIVPNVWWGLAETRDRALDEARTLARLNGVSVWLTCDRTHHTLVDSWRPAPHRPPVEAFPQPEHVTDGLPS